MTLAGNEQCSLLTLLRELTARRRRVASCALPHDAGTSPCPNLALNSVFALYVRTTRVKKAGWKQKRKKGRSPRYGSSCHMPSGQTKRLQTGRGNKAKLPSSLPALVMELASPWQNAASRAACGSLFLSRKAFISRGNASGSCPVAEDVRALCYCRSHRGNLHRKISNRATR